MLGRHIRSTHTFALEITRDNVHELVVWGKWVELDLWDIYDSFIRAEKTDSKIYLLVDTSGYLYIYATQHTPTAFTTKLHDEFIKEFRVVKDSEQNGQFARNRFDFYEVEKI